MDFNSFFDKMRKNQTDGEKNLLSVWFLRFSEARRVRRIFILHIHYRIMNITQ